MLSFIYSLILSFFDLAKLSFFASILVLPLFLLGSAIKGRIGKKQDGWLKPAFLSIFLVVLISVIAVYSYFPLSSLGASAGSPVDSTLADLAIFIIISFARSIIVSLAISLMLMPLALIGSYFYSYFSGKLSKGRKISFLAGLASAFLSIWATNAAAFAAILIFFQSLPVSILYFIFFAFG